MGSAAHKARCKAYKADPSKRLILKAARERWAKKNAVKKRAQLLVKAAVKAGKLVRQKCAKGKCRRRAEAHHEDYAKPLEVVWLCPGHHHQRHVEIRREKKAALQAEKEE